MPITTHTLARVPLDSLSWVSRKNISRQCGVSIRPVDTAGGLLEHSFDLFGTLFDQGGVTVSDSEIPSDGSLKMFLVSDDQVGGTLDALMTAHRYPNDLISAAVSIPYSVVPDDAYVNSVKMYAVSADGDDVTEELVSRYDIKDPGFTVPSEVEVSGDDAYLIAECDLTEPGVAKADITEFIKTSNYPLLALNISVVVEVVPTDPTATEVASVLWCPGVGPSVTFTTLASELIHFKKYETVENQFAYFGSGNDSMRVAVDLDTGLAKASAGPSQLELHTNGERKVTELSADVSIEDITYGVEFKIRNKLWFGQDRVEFTALEVQGPGVPLTPAPISADGEFTLINTPEDNSGMTQPTVTVDSPGVDVIRVRTHATDYDPVTSDIYHELEYTGESTRTRGAALLRDVEGKPVFVAVPPMAVSLHSTAAKIKRLYLADDSEYTDQYGTESWIIRLEE